MQFSELYSNNFGKFAILNRNLADLISVILVLLSKTLVLVVKALSNAYRPYSK